MSSGRRPWMISSPGNPAIKRIRSLRTRKGREGTGLFFAEGIRIVAEAIELGAEIETLVVAPDLLTSGFARDLVQAQRARGTRVLEVTSRVFDSLSGKEGPQGIGAEIRMQLDALEAMRPAAGLCWIVLEQTADPGNLGTILRTADATGAAGIILLGPSIDPFDPAVVRASMGAVFSQRIARADLEGLERWKREHALLFVGTSDAAPHDYREAAYPFPLALLMGSERHGLSSEARAICDALVRIPMAGRSDSLNLAVATGVMLYELYDRRHPVGRNETSID